MKILLYLAALSAILLVVGDFLGGETGLVIAFLFAILLNAGSYWYSDRLILGIYNATELGEEKAPNIYAIVKKLSKTAGIPLPKLYLVPLDAPNAFATGRDPEHSAVAVTYGILNILEKDELEGVLAHEIAHIKNRDTLISCVAATLAMAIAFAGRLAYWSALFIPAKDKKNRIGSFFSYAVMVILAPLIASLIRLAISRGREYLADKTGAEISKKPKGLASALAKIQAVSLLRPMEGDQTNTVTAHLFIINPFRATAVTNLFSTHPPTAERINKLESMV